MNKKFAACLARHLIVWMGGSSVVHGVLLHPDYVKLPNLFSPGGRRPAIFSFMILAHVLMSGAFVWIYSRGRGEARGSVRVSAWLVIALLTVVPGYTI